MRRPWQVFFTLLVWLVPSMALAMPLVIWISVRELTLSADFVLHNGLLGALLGVFLAVGGWVLLRIQHWF